MFIEFLKQHKILLITVAVILLANIVVFFLVTLPKVDADTINRNRLEKLTTEKTGMQKNLSEKQVVQSFINEKLSELSEFYQGILGEKSDKLIEVLEERETISLKFGVVPLRVSYSSESIKNRPLEKLTMSFPLKGTYGSLRFFINEIEHSDYFLLIDDVELENSQEESDMSMRIVVTTFFHGKILDEDEIYRNEEEEL